MKRELTDKQKRNIKKNFDDRFDELVVFIKQHGRFPVPSQNAMLSSCISSLKVRYHKGILDKEFYDRISLLGFEWEKESKEWQKRTDELKQFLIKGKRLPYSKKELKLKAWLKSQIRKLHNGWLSEDKRKTIEEFELLSNEVYVKRLTKTDIIMVEKEKKFEQEIQLLINFRAEHPDRWPDNIKGDESEKKLAKWCRLHKRRYMHNELEEQMIKQLEAIGFSFGVNTGYWYTRFNDLKAHLNKFKNMPCKSNDKNLFKWSRIQFRTFDFLSEDKQKLLDSIAFKSLFPG